MTDGFDAGPKIRVGRATARASGWRLTNAAGLSVWASGL
jgi:hypothetical protein